MRSNNPDQFETWSASCLYSCIHSLLTVVLVNEILCLYSCSSANWNLMSYSMHVLLLETIIGYVPGANKCLLLLVEGERRGEREISCSYQKGINFINSLFNVQSQCNLYDLSTGNTGSLCVIHKNLAFKWFNSTNEFGHRSGCVYSKLSKAG